jgi:short-subunit dehydrogenase
MKLQGITCLLTGATGGIGQQFAHALANEGVSLILVGRKECSLSQLCSTLPGAHQIIEADINTSQGRQDVVDACHKNGQVSMLINNAGVSGFIDFEQQTDLDIENIIAVNLVATMLLSKHMLPILKAQSKSALVNVGSAFGALGYPYFASYCASKFGLKGFTEALKRETANSSMQVMYFSPRATHTQINSPAVVAMNKSMGNPMDEPSTVARALIKQLKSGTSRASIGFAEGFFAKLNAICPALVDKALSGKLAVISQFVNKSSRALEGNKI